MIGELESAAALLGVRASELWPNRFRDRTAVRELVREITALSARCRDSDSRAISRLRWWGIAFLNELGDSAEQAILMARSLAADDERVLGSDHPESLDSRDNLAATYRIAGRVDEAITLNEEILTARERLLGTEHPSTLVSRNNLALAYRSAGRLEEAIALHEQVLAARDRVLGVDHPSTSASGNNLALAYRSAGRIVEAIALHERTLAARERVLGADHPSTLASRNNLALAYRSAGRIVEAIALHEQVLAARERVLGADHPSILLSRTNLARAYRSAGRTGEAVILEQRPVADGKQAVSRRPVIALDDRSADRMAEWQSRPLDPVYAVVFVDMVQLRIRAGRRRVHLAVGVTTRGERECLGLWMGESAEFLTEIKNRGTRDVRMVIGDEIAGLPEAVRAAWGKVVVRASVVHLLRNSPIREVGLSTKDFREMVRDLKPLYAALSEADAVVGFAEFASKWSTRYPAVVQQWRSAWPKLVSFLRLDRNIRTLITTNAVESMNAEFGRLIRAGEPFPTEEAALKHLYLVVTHVTTGRSQQRWTNRWQPTMNAFGIHRTGRGADASPP